MNLGIFAHLPQQGAAIMADDHDFQRIDALLASLAARIGGLNAGALDLDGLELATEEARELHERLIVLRHKAREKKVAERRSDLTMPGQGTPMHVVQETGPIRLDTKPPDGPRQITLIEAIEDQKQKKKDRSSAETKAPEKPRTSVSEKLGHAPIKDLGKAVALSQKFWFTAELFAKDAGAYERIVKRLNGATGLDEARAIVDGEVLVKLKKPPAPDALAAFMDLLERRFRT